MSNKFIKVTLFLCIFFIFSSISFSMSDEFNKIVTFQGEKKYIMNLLIAASWSSNHPFSVTPVMRRKNNVFQYHDKDDVFSLTSNDFKEIHRGNYVYMDRYALKKTRLSQGETVPVSVLFIGTNNENDVKLFNDSLVNNNISQDIR